MEVSSHALDQQRTAGLGFDAVVLTNVSQDHLDYHQDMQAYFEAKSRLFAEGSLRQDGRRIINADDEYGGLLLSEYPQAWRYGFQPTGGPSQRTLGARLEREDSKGVSLRCEVGGQHWSLTSPLVGRHNAANILAAQATALSLGISPADLKGLEQAQPVPGRLERVPNDQGLDIFVDYAHTPDALENVLQALRRLSPKRLIVVFGCGGDRDRGKRKLMGQAAARLADVVVLTSDNPRHERPEVIMAEVRPGLAACPRVLEHKGRKEAIAAAIELMTPADVLVVAGKGHETYQQIGDDYLEFSDVQVICEQLSCT
jgi:UDP-N-acetylmuramoyl-L-alanyl-D-glutamate--2,6-diaminopimelate ligase